MLRYARYVLPRVALALALAAGCTALLVDPAHAVPATTDASPNASALEAKKAEQAEAQAELERMRNQLAAKVEQYVAAGRKMARFRAEIIEVTAEIDKLDADLARMQDLLSRRAVQLYRGDRISMVEVILGTRSFQDLIVRTQYLVMINEHDARLMDEMNLTRTESLWLEHRLSDRLSQLENLQQTADEQRSQIETDVALQEAKARDIGQDIASLLRGYTPGAAGAAPSGAFNPDTLITDANYRAADSMSVEDIQSFLAAQGGTLDTYRALDHTGAEKSTAEMIKEAAVAWGVSPKVILVKLQKEQSLLSRKNPGQKAYDWAMGCGRADSRTFYQYQGFGKQIWFGTQKLHTNSLPWRAGMQRTIDGSVVTPTNASTWSLYRYTPHLHGNMSFWMLYWRYFGDPLA